MIYLDHSSTCPLDERVLASMLPFMSDRFGNSSSREHRYGWDAAEAVEEARDSVANAVHAAGSHVFFNGGATEGLNTVIRGYVGYDHWPEKKLVVCASEHAAVLKTIVDLSKRTGVPASVIPVDARGHIDEGELRASLESDRNPLVAVMAANNEIGTRHDVQRLTGIVHEAGGLVLCDTTQEFGRNQINAAVSGIDFATLSAHKIHGPKGVGALLCSPAGLASIVPLVTGGGQEGGLRSGTLNVSGIVGLGETCRLAVEQLEADVARMSVLRDRLEAGVLHQVSGVWINGDRFGRLCSISNMGFKGVDARVMIRDMHDIAVSTRSACSSGDSGPSHVLKAIGLSDEDAYSCIRFSLGRFTTQEEIDYTIEKVVTSAHKLRRLKSLRVN